MKKTIKRTILSLLLMIATIIPTNSSVIADDSKVTKQNVTSPAEIETKEEVIYGNLSSSGEVKEVYAVNIFNLKKEGIITDYGRFTTLKNLSNIDNIIYDNQSVAVYGQKGRFYYQGTLEEVTLPWQFSIKYYLDGEEITADQIAGREGEVEIQITVTTAQGDKMNSFSEHYLLQISVTLDTDLFENIISEGATIANSGKNQLLTYMVMPASEGNIVIKGSVTDFALEGIVISAIPFSTNIEIPDISNMSSDLLTLSDAVAQLNDGVNELKGGVKSLNSGAISLTNGSGDFMNGLKKLSNSSKELTNASNSILEALDFMNKSLENSKEGMDLSALQQLPGGLKQLSAGLKQIAEGITQLSSGYDAALTALNKAINTIPSEAIPEKELGELVMKNPNNTALAQLIENYKAAQTVRLTYQATSEAFMAVKTNLPTFATSINQVMNSMNNISTELGNNLGKTDMSNSVSDLIDGIKILENNYRDFDTGLKQYTEGILQLNGVYTKVHNGIQELSQGTNNLTQGVGELAEGTKELKGETQNLPDQIETKVDELLASYKNTDYQPVSFLSEKNERVSLVQFVLKTEKIEKKPIEQQETISKEKETFWTRLKDLFW